MDGGRVPEHLEKREPKVRVVMKPLLSQAIAEPQPHALLMFPTCHRAYVETLTKSINAIRNLFRSR